MASIRRNKLSVQEQMQLEEMRSKEFLNKLNVITKKSKESK